MSKGPLEQPDSSSQAETLQRSLRQPSSVQVTATTASSLTNTPELPPNSFTEIEGPTLSSSSLNSDSKAFSLAAHEKRIESLEERLATTERELAEVYGAVEHLVTTQENVERALKQQRYSRYLVWGTLILILAIFWMTLQTKMGNFLPR
jgi:uncharacterized coiled-coil protein SlyX